MTLIAQILSGGVLLALCFFLHMAVLSWSEALLSKLDRRYPKLAPRAHSVFFVGRALAAIVAGHAIQVWFWASALVILGALPNIEESVYFVLVTYTTLGYGDLTLEADFRVFGAISAVTGLLTFGLSTAFLVALLTKLRDRD